MFAGSRTPRAITDITPTTANDATSHVWFGFDGCRLPRLTASWNPAARVITTTVGMISTIFGRNRAENSARAGIESRARIGPRTSPTKRSIPVHRPPPATWYQSSAHRQFSAIATISKTTMAATMGSPFTGTTWMFGRGGASPQLSAPVDATACASSLIAAPLQPIDQGPTAASAVDLLRPQFFNGHGGRLSLSKNEHGGHAGNEASKGVPRVAPRLRANPAMSRPKVQLGFAGGSSATAV